MLPGPSSLGTLWGWRFAQLCATCRDAGGNGAAKKFTDRVFFRENALAPRSDHV
jgi:hypothetical protein